MYLCKIGNFVLIVDNQRIASFEKEKRQYYILFIILYIIFIYLYFIILKTIKRTFILRLYLLLF